MVVFTYRHCAKRLGEELLVSKYSLDDVNMVPTEWVQLKHTLDELLAGSVSRPNDF